MLGLISPEMMTAMSDLVADNTQAAPGAAGEARLAVQLWPAGQANAQPGQNSDSVPLLDLAHSPDPHKTIQLKDHPKIAQVLRHVQDSTVEIICDVPNGKNVPGSTLVEPGSGFFVTPEGKVHTANHVVSLLKILDGKFFVKTADGELFPAQVTKSDPITDQAELTVRSTDASRKFPTVEFADESAIKAAEETKEKPNVLGLGYPLDWDRLTASPGTFAKVTTLRHWLESRYKGEALQAVLKEVAQHHENADRTVYKVNINGQHGDSGGGVFFDNAKLIGGMNSSDCPFDMSKVKACSTILTPAAEIKRFHGLK